MTILSFIFLQVNIRFKVVHFEIMRKEYKIMKCLCVYFSPDNRQFMYIFGGFTGIMENDIMIYEPGKFF